MARHLSTTLFSLGPMRGPDARAMRAFTRLRDLVSFFSSEVLSTALSCSRSVRTAD